jgi:hypothetical protein
MLGSFRRCVLRERRDTMDTALAPKVNLRGQVGRFVLHYFEMCIPMCIGFAVGDLVYFSIAGLLGYSEPFTELPLLSVLVVTVAMTAPMTAWMLYRGMPRRATWEMSATMPILAIALVTLGGLGVVAMGDLALLMHGLMMPVMLVPMLLRPGLYAGHTHHARVTTSAS